MDPLLVGLVLVVVVLVVSQVVEATFGEGGAPAPDDGASPPARGRLGRLWERATPDRVVETLAMVLRLSPILGVAVLLWAIQLHDPPLTGPATAPDLIDEEEVEEPDGLDLAAEAWPELAAMPEAPPEPPIGEDRVAVARPGRGDPPLPPGASADVQAQASPPSDPVEEDTVGRHAVAAPPGEAAGSTRTEPAAPLDRPGAAPAPRAAAPAPVGAAPASRATPAPRSAPAQQGAPVQPESRVERAAAVTGAPTGSTPGAARASATTRSTSTTESARPVAPRAAPPPPVAPGGGPPVARDGPVPRSVVTSLTLGPATAASSSAAIPRAATPGSAAGPARANGAVRSTATPGTSALREDVGTRAPRGSTASAPPSATRPAPAGGPTVGSPPIAK